LSLSLSLSLTPYIQSLASLFSQNRNESFESEQQPVRCSPQLIVAVVDSQPLLRVPQIANILAKVQGAVNATNLFIAGILCFPFPFPFKF
jgi:hypothetical protein